MYRMFARRRHSYAYLAHYDAGYKRKSNKYHRLLNTLYNRVQKSVEDEIEGTCMPDAVSVNS